MPYLVGYDYHAVAEVSPSDKDPCLPHHAGGGSLVGSYTAGAANKKNISGSGCVEKAVENACRVVIDSQTGEIYNLQFSARAPKSGTAITFSADRIKGQRCVSRASW